MACPKELLVASATTTAGAQHLHQSFSSGITGVTTTTDCCITTAELLLFLRPLVSRRVALTMSLAAHGLNVAVDRQASSAYDNS